MKGCIDLLMRRSDGVSVLRYCLSQACRRRSKLLPLSMSQRRFTLPEATQYLIGLTRLKVAAALLCECDEASNR